MKDIVQVPYDDYDDDVYMADNETHKLREERKRGLRKSIRKGKGKARQVEDEDEEMENEEMENEEMENVMRDVENEGIYDGGDKSNNGQLSDIVSDFNFEESDNVFETAVHPLLLHLIRTAIEPLEASFLWWAIIGATALYILKAKGAAGPKLRAQHGGDANSDSNSESDIPQPLNTLPNPLNLSHDALAALTNTVLGGDWTKR